MFIELAGMGEIDIEEDRLPETEVREEEEVVIVDIVDNDGCVLCALPNIEY